jgi:hypothetical protein
MSSATLFRVLRDSAKEHWTDTLLWFIFTIFASLLPVWGSYLILRLFSLPIVFYDFVRNGEFALYSAALLAPALYLIVKEFGPPFIHRTTFVFLAVFALFVSGLVFASVTAISSTSTVSANSSLKVGTVPLMIDRDFMISVSLFLFSFTAFFSFLVRLVDTVRMRPDVEGITIREREELAETFDDTADEE